MKFLQASNESLINYFSAVECLQQSVKCALPANGNLFVRAHFSELMIMMTPHKINGINQFDKIDRNIFNPKCVRYYGVNNFGENFA